MVTSKYSLILLYFIILLSSYVSHPRFIHKYRLAIPSPQCHYVDSFNGYD